MIEVAWLIVLGLLAGALAAILGVGGGIIFVPALVIVAGFEQHLAQGTSLAVILLTVVVATFGHARRGRVSWMYAVPLGIASIGGALVGSRLALALDGDVLRRLFSVLLAVIAVQMALRARRLARGSS